MFIGVERCSFPRRFLSRLEFGGFSETCYHGQPGSYQLACRVSTDKRACRLLFPSCWQSGSHTRLASQAGL